MILFTDSIFIAPVRGWCRGFSNNMINRFLSESLLGCPLPIFIGCDSTIPQVVHELGSLFAGLEWWYRNGGFLFNVTLLFGARFIYHMFNLLKMDD